MREQRTARLSELLTLLGVGANEAARRLDIPVRQFRRMLKGQAAVPTGVLLALERLLERRTG